MHALGQTAHGAQFGGPEVASSKGEALVQLDHAPVLPDIDPLEHPLEPVEAVERPRRVEPGQVLLHNEREHPIELGHADGLVIALHTLAALPDAHVALAHDERRRDQREGKRGAEHLEENRGQR